MSKWTNELLPFTEKLLGDFLLRLGQFLDTYYFKGKGEGILDPSTSFRYKRKAKKQFKKIFKIALGTKWGWG